VINRLDVGAVGVEQECGVISRVVGPRSGLAVVFAACGDPNLVEAIDDRLLTRRKREMDAARDRT
jgi:hypothetical protein